MSKTNKKEATRNIPKSVSDELQKQHFFECAWCSTKLTERHHIQHYALGGKHTVDNLILLCPNCHTQVHDGKIQLEDLIGRKSTHLKNDRVEGTFSFDIDKPIFKMGGAEFIDAPYILRYRKFGPAVTNLDFMSTLDYEDEHIISWQKDRYNNVLLSIRLYNKIGDLVFWMANNRYWAPANFRIIREKSILAISSVDDLFFNIEFSQKADGVYVSMLAFVGGSPVLATPTSLVIGDELVGKLTLRDTIFRGSETRHLPLLSSKRSGHQLMWRLMGWMARLIIICKRTRHVPS